MEEVSNPRPLHPEYCSLPKAPRAPAHWGLGEIDGLFVPPGKASKLLTDHLITGKPLKSEPAQKKWFSQTIHAYKPYWFAWVVVSMKHILSVMTS